jgi:molybdopterin-dependent oxidoreductase alpha subunit
MSPNRIPKPETADAVRSEVLAEPSAALTGLRRGRVAEVAAGVPAVISTVRHILAETGPLQGLRLLGRVNQAGGFDCPGCAWPEPGGDRSIAEFCENGAKAVAEEGTNRRATPEFFLTHSVSALSRESDHWLGSQGRLTHPMILRRGSSHYQPISWQEAFATIAGELKSLASPDEAVFYTSGRTSNEAAFLYQLFVRQYGTNNLPDCSNMCHESSGVALSEVIGVGKGTVTLEDFDHAEAIVVIGQNPGTCHPRMLSALERAVRNGCRIVSINPLKEAGLNRFKQPQELMNPLTAPRIVFGGGTELACLHLPVRVNGDVALLKGVMKELLEMHDRGNGEVLDEDFIRDRSTGFEAFAAALRAETWPNIVAGSGVSPPEIARLATLLADRRRIIVTWAMGLTQHRNAVANIQEVVNLLLMKGSFGKPGAGACPVRGHSNVQGDRTMGVTSAPRPPFLDALADRCGFEPPRHAGYDTVEAIRAMHSGAAKLFIALGGNFLSATPDTVYTAAALRRCRLTVQISTKLNRAHLVTGEEAIILPCLGRTEADVQRSGEQFVSVENSMGIVHASRGRARPASEELRSEPAIVAQLAHAVFGEDGSVDWLELAADYDRIRDLIDSVLPGFDRYNSRVRERGGFALPNVVREGGFGTPDGKGHFTVHPIPESSMDPGRFLMMTVRSHDQFNTTIYGLDDRYRGILNERRVVMLNPADVVDAGLRDGQEVDLTSHFRGEDRVVRRFVVVPYAIPRGCAATYFPEANPLVPIGSVADGSNTPTSKSVIISIAPAGFHRQGREGR